MLSFYLQIAFRKVKNVLKSCRIDVDKFITYAKSATCMISINIEVPAFECSSLRNKIIQNMWITKIFKLIFL